MSRIAVSILYLVFTIIIIDNSQAATFRQQATITLIKASHITTSSAAPSLTIQAPTQNVVIDITPAGTTGNENTADFINTPTDSALQYTITTPQNVANLTVSDAQNVSGITFNHVHMSDTKNLLDHQSTLLFSDTPISLSMGTSLEIASTVENGHLHPELIIELSYD